MRSLVNLQILTSRKLLQAHGTLVRPLTGVDADVINQLILRFKLQCVSLARAPHANVCGRFAHVHMIVGQVIDEGSK